MSVEVLQAREIEHEAGGAARERMRQVSGFPCGMTTLLDLPLEARRFTRSRPLRERLGYASSTAGRHGCFSNRLRCFGNDGRKVLGGPLACL